jgi:hypothetical protein
MIETIDYDKPGIPVLRAVFTNMQGEKLWTEEPYQFSRISTPDEFLVKDSIQYYVRRVAVAEGVMYANVERAIE